MSVKSAGVIIVATRLAERTSRTVKNVVEWREHLVKTDTVGGTGKPKAAPDAAGGFEQAGANRVAQDS